MSDYIILHNKKIPLSSVYVDCIPVDLCVTVREGDSLLSVLQKMCTNISTTIVPSFTETDPVFRGSPAYTITNTNISNWNVAYNDRIVAAAFSGTDTKTLTLTQGDGGTITASFADLSGSLGEVNTASNIGGGTGVFASKVGVDLQFKTLTAGTGISLSPSSNEIMISSNLVISDQYVKVTSNDSTAGYLMSKLVAGGGITLTENNDGGNETLSVINAAPDIPVVLTAGAAIDITGTYPNFTIIHEDTSSVSNLDTSGSQVIDTLTFDTFGHVQTVTTRNLIAADIPDLSGYYIQNQFATEQNGNFWARKGLLTAQQSYGVTAPVAALTIIGGGILPVPTVGIFIGGADNSTEALLQIESYANQNVFSVFETAINIGHQGALPTGGMMNMRLTDAYKGLLIRGSDNTTTNLFEGQDNMGVCRFSVGDVGEAYFGASQKINRRLSTITTTLDEHDYYLAGDATLGNITINLPTAVGNEGLVYLIKKIDSSANTVTVDASGAETMDGAGTIVLAAQWDWVKIVSNNVNWEIIG